MKRKMAWLALPLVLAALVFGVKWRAEHPTVTEEDLQLRALLSQASHLQVKFHPIVPSVPSKPYEEDFPLKRLKLFIQTFHVLPKTSIPRGTPLNVDGSLTFIFYNDDQKTENFAATIDVGRHEGTAYDADPNGRRDIELHPVTVKRWIDLLQTNPRIGPELRVRMNQ